MRKRKNSAPKRDIALELAIEAAGGISSLAQKLGMNKQAVWEWRRVPPKRAIAVEAATGGVVSRHRLRPDIFGPA